MDASTQKPFACKADGCGMSFTNEDHLSVHEKKHEMVLNLGLENKGSSVFVADQTPTPTRLIKNCEEVGLFDDLKHVNPFDETFRRAVESKGSSDQNDDMPIENTALSENPLLSSEDSLHTPQVFPNVEENRGEFKIERQEVILSDSINFKAKKVACKEEKKITEKVTRKRKLSRTKSEKGDRSKKCSKIASAESRNKKTEPITRLPIILRSTISVIQPQVIALGFSMDAVASSKRILLPKPAEPTNQQNSTQALPVKERLKVILNDAKRSLSQQNGQANSKTDEKHMKENPKHIYDDDSMERRRAAAMRYRRKVKKEQADLRKKNAELIAENSELKAIIKHLKQALMAHQNCEISRATSLGTNIQLDGSSSVQIQPATVKLVMNIPKLVIHPAGKVPLATVNLANAQN